MGKKLLLLILLSINFCPVYGSPASSAVIKTDVITVSLEQQYDAVKPGAKSALAVHFKLEKNWHFYASSETAPAQMNLKVNPSSANNLLIFSEPIFPKTQLYNDKSSGQKLDVFGGTFTVYIPFAVSDSIASEIVDANVAIDGALCSDMQCRPPEVGQLTARIKISPDTVMTGSNFTLPESASPDAAIASQSPSSANSVWFALILALLAGFSLNIMPCVWPVLPIVVMRLVEQSKQSKRKSITMGFSFCLGILLFFVALAAANIILQLVYGTVLQWGDQFRNPAFVAAMAILLVILALFMFDIFTFVLPSAVASKSGSGKGFLGSVAMGFFAAVLSTPCSFAILAAAFAWAQSQPLPMATLAIMTIGLGMAIPYAILTSTPHLLKKIPKPGRWMELFKQTIGFVLLVIAVKLITALPETRLINVLYFVIILSFSAWMWGIWVGHNTKTSRKWTVRIIAILLILVAGWVFLSPEKADNIDWQPYEANSIQTAIEQHRPVLIKFTADWCLNCQVVEKTVYSRFDIAELFKEKNVLVIKADTTEKDFPATLALKNIYKQPGVPVSILLVPGQKEPIAWNGMFFADQLKDFLQKLPMDKK